MMYHIVHMYLKAKIFRKRQKSLVLKDLLLNSILRLVHFFMSLFSIKMFNTKVQIFNCRILAYYYFDTLPSLLIISRCTDIFLQRTKHTIDVTNNILSFRKYIADL